MEEKKAERRSIKIFKRVSPITMLFLALTLSANLFAWFVYTTKVDSTITAHVKGWNVNFMAGNTQLSQQINFDVANIYPGMVTHTDSISVTNNGEMTAILSYEIESATILGTEYRAGRDMTSSELLAYLENHYPFTIAFSTSNNAVAAGGGTSTFTLTVSWPYESGDDATDTFWGEQAYDYKMSHPSAPSISLVMKITAMQN